jgi:hypothetical protein
MQHLILYSEIIALIAGLLVFKQLQPGHLKVIVLILFLIVSTEISAVIMKRFDEMKGFVPQLYNIMLPVQFCLYSYVFLKETKNVKWKRLLLLITIAFLVFVIVVLLQQREPGFNTRNYAAGSVMLSIYSLRFIYQKLLEDGPVAFWDNFLFYAAAGMVVFYIGTLPFHAMRNYLFDNYPRIFFTYRTIFYVLGCIMYLVFAFGFYKAVYKKVSPE